MYLRPHNDWHFASQTETWNLMLWLLFPATEDCRHSFWRCGEMCNVGSQPQAVESEGCLNSLVARHMLLPGAGRTEAKGSGAANTLWAVPFCVIYEGVVYLVVFRLLLYLALEKMITSRLHGLVGSQSKSRRRGGPSESHGHIWLSEVLVLSSDHLLSFSPIIWRIQELKKMEFAPDMKGQTNILNSNKVLSE